MQIREFGHTGLVIRIVRQRGGHQRAGIADDHNGRPNPSPSRSSERAATSVVRLCPAPNQAGGHGRFLTARRWRRTSSSTAGTSSSGSFSTSRSNSSRCAVMNPAYAGRRRPVRGCALPAACRQERGNCWSLGEHGSSSGLTEGPDQGRREDSASCGELLRAATRSSGYLPGSRHRREDRRRLAGGVWFRPGYCCVGWEGMVALWEEAMPFLVAAVRADGAAVLAGAPDAEGDTATGVGRRLLWEVFGGQAAGARLPEALAALAASPDDAGVLDALGDVVAAALYDDPDLQASVVETLTGFYRREIEAGSTEAMVQP